ncbi:chemotaxis protein CheV [Trichlorobacter ammonificans]|uniref:Chemotaxis protein CheV n=1 Tax=Trichlorobacter ammonificans TaxID=2916410 RepID=A0ABN8HHW9_9BACT|nr:chemotaxis protein [Trichlorobacter ammonificans]CAH2030780.1 Chemotaxis protein CheV [Trichlorobacter ammonificans]
MSSSTLDEALKRTSLSRSNQMEMLTFRLTDGQLYGINVFKIIEILESPSRFDRMPHAHPAVKGAVDFRGKPIVAIDLSQALGMAPVPFSSQLAYLIICEYSKQLNAFIIEAPDSLLTRSWDQIHKPEGVQARSLVAIAYADNNETILLLDIEGILADVIGHQVELRDDLAGTATAVPNRTILLVDDSKTALLMMEQTLERLGFRYQSQTSAVQALALLQSLEQQGVSPFDLIISDIEMPGMDGFSFTRTLRELPAYKDCKVILHSSMSNPTNRLKAEEAGADDFVAKFDPNTLSEHIFRMLGAPGASS